MKRFVFITIALLVINTAFAQQCPVMPDFSTACSTTTNIYGCATWTDNCGAGWTRSHGTPQMMPYTDYSGKIPVTSFYAYMWSANQGSSGEGMFYNTSGQFLANHSYSVMIRLSAAGGNGSVLVYAANGLTQSPLTGCGNTIPNITNKQLIGTYSGLTSNQWVNVSFTFVANANYSQLWIYPQASTATQYDSYIMDASACSSCDGTIIYNTNIPANESQAGTIWAGSTAGTGGTGTTTILPDQTTSFLAGNEINLLSDFEATVTTGTFSAEIGCNSGAARKKVYSANVPVSGSHEGNSLIPQNNTTTDILIYPSVSTGMVTISGDNTLNNSLVTVVDQAGRLVYSSRNNVQTNIINLDLSSLKNGVYFVQVKNALNQAVKKVIINR